MYTLALREYVRLLMVESLNEGKLREAEISGNRKVPWGCEDHINDLGQRVANAEYWRNKYPRGSEKRSHYRNILAYLKNELKSAKRVANQIALNEKDEV